mgnify:CR=1 FL=1
MKKETNLNKSFLIKYLISKTGYTRSISKKIIDDFIQIVIKEVKIEKLNLKNLGSFEILQKKERLGRNPITKQIYKISARKTIKFSPSKKLTEKINE